MYFNSTSIGSIDNFVSAFGIGNTNMAWSTYLGSPNQETQNLPYGGTSIALTSANVLHLSGCSASFNTFPLDNGAGVPFFQPQNASTNIGSTGTITRFDMLGLNTYVGLKDFPNTSFSFGLYPNPTTSYLKIDNIELANQDLRFAIYDLSGKKLAEGQLESGLKGSIDVSFLQHGVYIINVSNGIKTFNNMFIKSNN